MILVDLSSPGPSGPALPDLGPGGGASEYLTKDDPDEILAAVLRCLASGAANSD